MQHGHGTWGPGTACDVWCEYWRVCSHRDEEFIREVAAALLMGGFTRVCAGQCGDHLVPPLLGARGMRERLQLRSSHAWVCAVRCRNMLSALLLRVRVRAGVRARSRVLCLVVQIALQFPDSLLPTSSSVVAALKVR